VRLEPRTPNALEYDVDAALPGDLVIINQNYDPSWRLARGTGQVFGFGALHPRGIPGVPSLPGLLAVIVPAGHQRLELRYRPASVIAGAAISLITLLVSLALWFAERRKAITIPTPGGPAAVANPPF